MNSPRFFRSFLWLTVLLLVVVILHISGVLHFIETPLTRMLYKGSQALYTLTITGEDDVYLKTLTGEELRQAYMGLQERYNNIVVDVAQIKELQKENENLKEQLQFFSEKDWTYYTGRVTGKQINPFESTILMYIDHASETIPVGAPAITKSGIFVGTVVAVDGNIINIQLLNDGRTKVGASFLNDERTIGVAEGGYGKSIRVNFIPQNEKIAAGDIVVTSGLTQLIPYGLPIGTIETVEKEPYEPFQSALLTPLAAPNSLEIISIIVEQIAT